MSFDPRDYDGVTYKSERRERDEQRELQAQEDDEQLDAVHAAAAGWRRAVMTAIRQSEAA